MNSRCVIHYWLIDMASGSLIHQQTGEQRRLGEYQFKLLLVLVQHAGKILTRDELNTLVWERRVIGNNSLPNAIHALRLALEDDGKQQRIIKTVPRKGYILEAEFCEFLSPEQPLDSIITPPTHHVDGQDTPAISQHAREKWQNEAQQEHLRLTQQRKEKRRRFWRWMCCAQTMLLVLVTGFLFLNHSEKTGLRLTEQERQLYSQIRIFALTHLNDQQAVSEDIPGIMGPGFFALNQILTEQRMTMQVFYATTSTTLKYTLVITSACDHRQLAMNIAQFRNNSTQLNTLIYRETERKIHEMANCINQSDGTDVNHHRNSAVAGSFRAGTETIQPF